jgi:hypothetical protein
VTEEEDRAIVRDLLERTAIRLNGCVYKQHWPGHWHPVCAIVGNEHGSPYLMMGKCERCFEHLDEFEHSAPMTWLS